MEQLQRGNSQAAAVQRSPTKTNTVEEVDVKTCEGNSRRQQPRVQSEKDERKVWLHEVDDSKSIPVEIETIRWDPIHRDVRLPKCNLRLVVEQRGTREASTEALPTAVNLELCKWHVNGLFRLYQPVFSRTNGNHKGVHRRLWSLWNYPVV